MTHARPTALVTGASSGIGAAFARELARRGYDVVIVARRAERLDALAHELHAQHGVTVTPLPADLTDANDLDRVAAHINRMDRLTLLINNAGYNHVDAFDHAPLAALDNMLALHNRAVMHLTYAAIPGMKQRGGGAILNVSSGAAFFPLPYNVIYSATKAFLNTFSAGLNAELAGTGVRVQAMCPGFARTELVDHIDAGGVPIPQVPDFLWMSAEAVAREGLDLLETRRSIVVTGWIYRLFFALMRNPLGSTIMARAARRAGERGPQ